MIIGIPLFSFKTEQLIVSHIAFVFSKIIQDEVIPSPLSALFRYGYVRAYFVLYQYISVENFRPHELNELQSARVSSKQLSLFSEI